MTSEKKGTDATVTIVRRYVLSIAVDTSEDDLRRDIEISFEFRKTFIGEADGHLQHFQLVLSEPLLRSRYHVLQIVSDERFYRHTVQV